MQPKVLPATVHPVLAPARVAPAEAAADPRQQDLERALAGQIGKTLRGEVLARFKDGQFLVAVAGQQARMALPPETRPGATLDLKLIGIAPRPTFELQGGATPAAPEGVIYEASAAMLRAGTAPVATEPHAARAGSLAGSLLPASPAGEPGAPAAGVAAAPPAQTAAAMRAAALLGNAPLTPAAMLPEIDPHSAPAHLSSTAQLLGRVLGAATPAPAAISAPAPLLASVPAQPQALAAALQHAIADSGLFYESHLQQWSEGGRSLAELAREPQMQQMAAGHAPDAAEAGTATLISLQLATHEQGRIAWEGQPWPGQHVHLEIERDAPHRGRTPRDGDGDGAWRSGMKFRMGTLGEVAATVVLAGGRLHIDIEAADGATGALLQAHAQRLAGALDAAGTPLTALAIRTRAGDRDD